MWTGENGNDALNYVLGVSGVGGMIWAIYERLNRLRVEQAQNNSSVAESNANVTLFNMLTQRLNSVEEEVRRLNKELIREREYTEKLIAIMKAANLQPPPYPDDVTT